MATTLVSFLGKGRLSDPKAPRLGYARTTYQFPLANGGNRQYTTSIFGVALLRFLMEQHAELDRWVVLGTSGSTWSELNQVLPSPDAVPDQYLHLDDLSTKNAVDPAEVSVWQEVLNANQAPTQMRLCMTGAALDPLSQQQIAQALFHNIPRGNDVAFDISNGFRHQPVIATFMVSLMRRTHDIGNVSFYSGVFEAANGGPTPVLELPICQKILEATEAAAVLDVTGNYEPVARCLGRDAGRVWFLENTNQLGPARNAAQQLNAPNDRVDTVSQEISRLLCERLQQTTTGDFSARFQQSARTALANGDYLRAVVLAYESILVLAGRTLYPGEDSLDFVTRKRAQEHLRIQLGRPDRQTFTVLTQVRNACAHGSRPDWKEAQRALQDPPAFRQLIESAFALFDRLPRILGQRN